MFSLIVYKILPNQNEVNPRWVKRAGSIQYGYIKCGTSVCCSLHLHMETARIKEDKETEKENKQEWVHMKNKLRKKTGKSHFLFLMHLNYPYIVWNNVPKFHENRDSSFELCVKVCT